MNRSTLGQLISTAVFYGVSFLIFLNGMEFIENGEVFHGFFSFFCALLCFLAGMRFAIAKIIKKFKQVIIKKDEKSPKL